MTGHKHCYGTMFHDSLHFSENDQMQGKVFSFELDSVGLARSARSIQTDLAEWDDCLACAEFAHCYKLCMAKLALENAISDS
ncbi:hypothetical protein [uncultured Tateyamaria sp.]|uniref:hypothetical protein n=1 Tax=uncultured Tateyamaria sp. TaxID=455651 RepID=UPI00261EEF5F|nr:hypothetical protein [uncultured Tateyamaria sp.]